MRISKTALGVCAAMSLALAAPGMAGAQVMAGPTTVLDLQLNEGSGAKTANDASGYGHDGAIGRHIRMNGSYADWDRHPPNAGIYYGADHLLMVPDAADGSLDPDSADFTIEFRMRSTDKFGNVIQKGQARTFGGQIKFQQPRGYMSCMFKSPTSQAAIKSSIFTSDGQWHTIRCERTSTELRLYVDGVLNKRIRKWSGNINNNKPWTIGGKFDCDTSDPTVGADSCDYYPGDIDYITMWKG